MSEWKRFLIVQIPALMILIAWFLYETRKMKFILMLLCVSACSTHTDPVCKVTYPVMAGDSNYEVEASADTTSEAETLAFRVINKACGGYYPTRRVSVLSETFATDKKATVRIQFACVK